MQVSEIRLGASYEDAPRTTVRTVTGIAPEKSGEKVVVYFEEPADEQRPLYWPLREMKEMPLGQFAAWATGPKRHLAEEKGTNWLPATTEGLA
ncbi:MAG: hypothetical protein A3C93_06275 [Candidatus Lloydbacteria bacterium RIFCSPHIGHO2_02_FULL_54_17]|uniref:DUF1653 domain-containing protein n=1 Tax=Candidatus Lloydbacteria bacterium RIFCSPHIGHO2_02_FULL_54_17 TaxID=1798664 RepID=A0A1G2DGP4_9BACT|nr:MAG: hypothetical protein A3C93_06275 [Candidatus Lloydbacteria bacterium RIFCSPHIGHO2_02_FULL_54_17]OGZ13535.1 MAG: hypothetical protein A2948_04940 [Candidatus Lloydbacteria bacterium RIFCSPLOWO2_01_FULL_54_18]OGZ16206.1 MAG: hypothetical protein A3H76_03775 [Candidatus Lloydbacteria bacterium RIFCSPLOWO2_02_FULL_54_12]